MKDNPFTSDIFSTIWLKHFYYGKSVKTNGVFQGLNFVKHKYLPLQINVGETHTKGINYSLSGETLGSDINNVFLIYDIPSYFNLALEARNQLKCYRIRQYPGFLIQLKEYEDLDTYLIATFSKSSRYKLKKYRKRLEISFDINYKMYHEEISKENYDFIFGHFKLLLEKRFEDKQTTNNNLDPKEWNFYQEVAYPMILDGKASLFVIYDGKTPIGVTLNYLSDKILFDAITVFDIDYSKFHVGSVTIMKLVEWCIDHGIEILDFSKGYFEYKKKWANLQYNFEYHIYYDKSNILASTTAFALKKYFELKQFLRDKKINEKIHNLSYRLKNKTAKRVKKMSYEFSENNQKYSDEQLIPLDISLAENQFLRSIIFDFLYLNMEEYKDLKVFKVSMKNSIYLLKGKKTKVLAQIYS